VGGHRARLPLTILGAAVAAGIATLILRPRGGLIEPAAVDPAAYFSQAELDRAADFRGTQRLIGLGSLAVSGATLAVLALRPPARLARLLDRRWRRPVLAAAAAGAGISLTLVVTGLPLSLWAHERAVDAGLSTQSLGPWLGDVGLSAAIGAVFAAAGGAVAVALLRRLGRRWWIAAAGVVIAFAAGTIYLSPIVIDPIFNRFEPLPPGELRSDVLSLADEAGVDVGEVYRMDASRRTTALNAYVAGLGQTKRVVIYDTLLDDLPPAQVRSVVAHELAHQANHDLPLGLLWVAIVAPAGTLLVQRGAERIAGRGALPGSAAALPALALALGLVSFALTVAGNASSRPVEARADAFALKLTGEPRPFVELARSLARRNLSEPQPPGAFHTLFGTHPTTVERIGFGVAYDR
jgi:STE24 endopeptidase